MRAAGGGFEPANPIAYTMTFSSSARFMTSFNDEFVLACVSGASAPSLNTRMTRRPSW